MRVFTFVGFVFLVVPVSTVMAQVPSTDEQSARARCFRGQPLPACKSFWITEAGYVHGLVVPQNGERYYPTWELGMMANRGEHSAIGGTLYAGVLNGFRWGLKGRYRHWLNSSTSIDFAPGILVGAGEREAPGFTGHVGMNFGDQIALVSQWDVTRNPWYWNGSRNVSRTEVAWFGGLKLGSKPALYGVGLEGLAVLVLGVAFIIACSGGGCFD